jgi:hypothetical protein
VTFFPRADVMIRWARGTLTQFSAKVGALDGECSAPSDGRLHVPAVPEERQRPDGSGRGDGVTGGTLMSSPGTVVSVAYVNPTRLSDPVGDFGDRHVACAIDYFVAPISDQLRSKLGNQASIRTTPPVCGEVAQDVANTAAGRWFQPGSPTYPEDPHLALAHDNVAPSLGVFSVGTSIPSLPANVYTFAPVPIGRVNLDFRYVTTVGEIICYAVSRNQRVLLQLVSAVRIRLEGIGPGACGDPGTWAFSAGAVEFERYSQRLAGGSANPPEPRADDRRANQNIPYSGESAERLHTHARRREVPLRTLAGVSASGSTRHHDPCHQGNEKRRRSGKSRPGDKREKPGRTKPRRGRQRVNHAGERQKESPDRNRYSHM